MSNKTQLQTNNTQLASLIQVLQGKATGGGGSVETCTVTLYNFGFLSAVIYNTYDNGVYTPVLHNIPQDEWETVFTTVKGQSIAILATDSDGDDFSTLENAELIAASYDTFQRSYVILLRISGDATIE